jgi:hypothetical protein
MALGAVFLAPAAAQAEFEITRWEALTCKTDATAPGLGNWAANGDPCEASEPERQFTQAGGHPNKGITAFLVKQITGPPPLPEGYLKEIRVELPRGLAVNPEATDKCTEKQLSEVVAAGPPLVTKCTTEVPGSLVGVDYFTTLAPGPAPPAGTEVTIPALVYNIDAVNRFGVPSMAGFNASGEPTYLVGELDPADQHVSFNITNIKSFTEGGPPIIGSRLVFNGKAGDGYLTLPTSCEGPQVTGLFLTTHPYPTPTDPQRTDSADAATPTGATGCENVPFKPTISINPDGPKATDSPEPITVDLGLPYEANPEAIINSYVKTFRATLPAGMGLNPASATGLVPCTDAQYHKDTDTPIECPAASEIGTVEVETPSLPNGSVGGKVYVAAPLKNGPGAASSGEQFRIFVNAFGPARDVNVRLVGNVFPNPVTGQLTAVVDNNPEAPFTSFKVHINGGPHGTLTTPDTCGPNKTETNLTPWSGNLDQNTPSSEFNLTSLPGGGACPKTLAERPFAPGYTAKSDVTTAGAYSPFRVNIARKDGQQELKVVNVTLPKGLTGKLAGIPYCPDASIAAAEAQSGKAEQASSSCSSASQIGTTETAAGSGADPFKIAGKAFLAGPYKGAPLSMVVITPGVAGPYDIGTVVVRVALNVNPETAQINAVSDPIPNVFGGVKLDLRRIDVNVDRSQFMLNPTNCAAQATSGVLNGGGSNPTNPAAFSSYGVSAPYQATDCSKLGFKPTLHTRLFGPVKRAKNPRIRAILETRPNDANISRTALTLPHSLFLDQSHIRTVCTRVQLKAKACPKASVYGNAEAKSPLLDGKLKGPVYLVSSDNPLPDLVADLNGQVNIQLHGIISSKRGGIKTVFSPVPDVPVKKFILNMKGGKKSLLVNSRDLCKSKQSSVLNMKAQNGKKVKKNKLPLKVSGCSKKHKKK